MMASDALRAAHRAALRRPARVPELPPAAVVRPHPGRGHQGSRRRQRAAVSIRDVPSLTCRHELLDSTLIWNQRHLLYALRELEQLYNEHRPHRTLRAAAPLRPLPEPIADPERIAQLDVRRRDRLGALSMSTGMLPDQHGRIFGTHSPRRSPRARLRPGPGLARPWQSTACAVMPVAAVWGSKTGIGS